MSEILLTDVRKKFLDYFKKNNHKIVESSNLVPNNDPTLMFTNSGMVQFKNVFTGLEKRPYKRATTSQKCVRAGGKHNDLENVGYTPRHHTFFEMLGNFSFGDYFKEQAIHHAWNLLTKDFGLPKEKLSVTVFHEDSDAFELWKKIAGISESKIIKISTSDNFWSMGDTGPCGPCSEIFYDHGDKLKGGPPGSPDEDGDRFIEIWNLVFMQFEQISKQSRVDLPKPSVDTGMGLERMTAVLQGTHDNYKIDHFKKIMSASADITKKPINTKSISSHRVIADHLRASSFLIAEGILPSNEGRGYVLRRIMRRGMRHAHSLGSKNPVFYKLFKVLLNEMKNSYPELNNGKELIIETLKNEEEKFSSLLERGMKILDENLSKVQNKTLPGSIAFKLYDTYGFPLDLTADILRGKNIKVDYDSFEKEMEKSKTLARANWKGSGDKSVDGRWFKIREEVNPTEFLGYEFDKAEGVVIKIAKNNQFVNTANFGEEIEIITNQTPFYGESGGQVGDQGYIFNSDCKIKINDTQKKMGDLFVHFGKIEKGSISIGQNVNLEIDVIKRNNSKANHSATHLLHESLRRTLGKHVTQKGSLVSPDRLRFDFSHNKPIEKVEMEKINKLVNEIVNSSSEVQTRIMTPKEAISLGALALFGEKYGDEVRVVFMGKENNGFFSTELCGGTHVKNTKEVGNFKVISQSSIASGVRRVEALRDIKLEEYEKNQKKDLNLKETNLKEEIESIKKELKNLKINPEYKDSLDLSENLKNLNKQINKVKIENIKKDKSKNFIKDKKIGSVLIREQILKDFPPKELRSIIDQGKKEIKTGIVVCVSIFKDKVGIAVGVSQDLTSKYDAVNLVKAASSILGGKGGGGRKDFAQAGGVDKRKIEEAFKEISKKIS
ncbi:MAG: alanine--tRNA ligase [Pelagibacteraceae bacterium TMED216]|nr:MAG: alanine--tRNA ligase [Pelagibacteraceae bacterium TMED216]|tara:strand:- start:1028 stop:3703 length:2676 start_codon:yes stop_codon:yes gene_type:complete